MIRTLLLTHTPFEKRMNPEARIVKPARRAWPKSWQKARKKVEVGCLSHASSESPGLGEMANAKRRLDFYSRWHGLKPATLQIWRAS
ncbi:hypothetical protein [Halomonas cupida]|uniref:Uncharacterized protein n=1 Tax=Halomonas cupida TaxID=44933 RepID=A0A1M7HVU6_9GAMM|nr:hypothetical protein [Halomonas cupida]GEN23916.1 hypothetical protein HCU01_18650 [Halomonas cupida]SHM32585.1 hypothetical protein SAMN05660971_02702 [Halomonas cupida]